MNIVVLEDEEDIQTIVQFSLSERHDIKMFSDAIEAMHPSVTDDSQVALIDLMLPHTSGVNAIRWFRRWAPHMRLVVVSAMPESQIHQTLEMVDAHLPKPFTPNELETVLG